jgi:hypothetical protein
MNSTQQDSQATWIVARNNTPAELDKWQEMYAIQHPRTTA